VQPENPLFAPVHGENSGVQALRAHHASAGHVLPQAPQLLGSFVRSEQQPVMGLPSGSISTLLGVEIAQQPQQPQLVVTWIWTVCDRYPGAPIDTE
jgi:hypothetical protein